MQKKFRIDKRLNNMIKNKCRDDSETFQTYITNLIKQDLGVKGVASTSLFSQKQPSKLSKLISQLGNHEATKALITRLHQDKSIQERKANGEYKGRTRKYQVNNEHPTQFQHAVDAYMNRKNNGLTVAKICQAYGLNVKTFYNNLHHYRKTGALSHYQSELKTK